mgnify:CR=1 FL=1
MLKVIKPVLVPVPVFGDTPFVGKIVQVVVAPAVHKMKEGCTSTVSTAGCRGASHLYGAPLPVRTHLYRYAGQTVEGHAFRRL